MSHSLAREILWVAERNRHRRQISELVLGVVLIGAAGVSAIQQLVMLARRHKSVGALQLVGLPAAWPFRVSLMLIAQGVLLLLQRGDSASQWTVIGIWAALFGWHSALWLRCRWRRHRPAAQ